MIFGLLYDIIYVSVTLFVLVLAVVAAVTVIGVTWLLHGDKIRFRYQEYKKKLDVVKKAQGMWQESVDPLCFPDTFRSYEELELALRSAGLESSNLILAVDYTKSNKWQGTRAFGGKCLHDCDSVDEVGAVTEPLPTSDRHCWCGVGAIRRRQLDSGIWVWG